MPHVEAKAIIPAAQANRKLKISFSLDREAEDASPAALAMDNSNQPKNFIIFISYACCKIKNNNGITTPPPAFCVGGEVVHLGYPVRRELFFIRVEDKVAEVSEPGSITTPTRGWILDALLEDFCAEFSGFFFFNSLRVS